MKRNVIINGLISGLIISSWCVGSVAACYISQRFEGNMLLGYSTMLAAFSLVFVGIKNYRDNYNQGTISFGKAFKIGLYITSIASTMYVTVWIIDYYVFIPDFMEKFSAVSVQKIKASSVSAADMKVKLDQIAQMKTWYKSPAGVIALTYLEILPVGLVVTLIAALILKRKQGDKQVIPA